MMSSVDYYWIPDKDNVYIKASIVEQSASGLTKFRNVDGNMSTCNIDDCVRYEKDEKITDTDDMITLSDVNQASILHCTKKRFFDSKIYTSLGSVLMLVNPFKRINALYGQNVIETYANPYSESQPSHIYNIPSRAYEAMIRSEKSQSILISGESGAGKTEATKECLAFLTAITSSNQSNSEKNVAFDVANRIIASSPIMEAFGNAQTIKNPNSSRFGKWMEIRFDKRGNRIVRSRIESYLLEKSRVTKHDSKERNYHIFYQIIRGADSETLNELGLSRSTLDYYYLCGMHDHEASDLDDKKRYEETSVALKTMGFTEQMIKYTLSVIAAVLHLGNIRITADASDGASISLTDESLIIASKLLDVEMPLLRDSLTTTIITSASQRRSIIKKSLSVDRSTEIRNSVARELFDRLFRFIIDNVNNNANKRNSIVSGPSYEESEHYIGLLDIFGFEIFDINSMEQLCINYCNEILQGFFNHVIFEAEKQLYIAEGISCSTINCKENIKIINEIQILFKALDEEAKIPKGNSTTWYEKLRRATGVGKKDKDDAIVKYPPSKNVFIIKHYAGNVEYLPQLFMEKNLESLSHDVGLCLALSKDDFMAKMFSDLVENKEDRRTLTQKSITYKFQGQLQSLINMLKLSDSHFIRCVKSNDQCKPMTFDPRLIHRQLVYLGIFEVVKIQQSGLPCRMSHTKFNQRFKSLLPIQHRWGKVSMKEFLRLLRSSTNLPLGSAQIGTNLFFCKGPDLKALETRKFQVETVAAIKGQKWLRRWINRHAYRKILRGLYSLKEAIVMVNKEVAIQSLDIIVSACSIFSNISNQNILDYKLAEVQASFNLMENRINLVQQANTLLKPTNQNDYESLGIIIKEAEKLSISENPTIKICVELFKPYEIAINGIVLVNSANIGNQTIDNIGHILNSLSLFNNIIPMATQAYSFAKSYKESIEQEISLVYEPMMKAYELSLIRFDTSTLAIVGLSEKATEASSRLKQSMEGIKFYELKTVEAKFLFQDASIFLILKDEVYGNFDFEKAVQIIDEYQPLLEITKSQLLAFKEWANFYLSCTMLPDALKSGFIVDSEAEGIPIADVTELNKFLKLICVPANPPPKLLLMRRLVTWIINIRDTFNQKEFELLESTIAKAEIDHQSTHIFADYRICLDEFKNCKLHVEHHRLMTKLSNIVKEPVFATYSIDINQQDTLLKNIKEKYADVREAYNMAKGSDASKLSWPRLSALIVLIEDLLGIHHAVEMRQENSLQLLDNFFKTHSLVLRRHHDDFFDILQKEKIFCEQIISFRHINDKLDDGLSNGMAIEYNYSESTPYYSSSFGGYTQTLQEAYHQFIEWQSSQEILGCFKSLPVSITNKVTIAENILAGRQTLQLNEFDDDYNWEETVETLIENQQKINPFPDKYFMEYDIIVRELRRRKVIRQLRLVISKRCIIGSISAGVTIDDNNFKDCQTLLNILTANMSNEIQTSPINILSLHKIAITIMELRVSVLNKLWNDPKIIPDTITRLKTFGHHVSLRENPVIPSLSQELELVHDEYSKQLHIRKLREALCNLTLGVLYHKKTNSVVFQTDAIEKRVANINKFSSYPECADLINVSMLLIKLFKDFSENTINISDKVRIENIIDSYKKLNLDYDALSDVRTHVRITVFLMQLHDLLSKSIQTAEEMSILIDSVDDIKEPFLSLYVEPARRVLGLYNSKASNSWVSIVENATSVDHALDPMDKDSKGTELELKCYSAFKYICRQGYQLALLIKNKTEEERKFEALLSPNAFERKKQAKRRLSSWCLDDKRGKLLHEDENNNYGIYHLREAGYDDATILDMNFPLKLLWASNFCPLLLRTKGKYSASNLKAAGYTCSEVYAAGYSIEQLKQAGFDAIDLYDTGASCQDLKFVGFDADNIIRAGYTISQMKTAGFSLSSLHKAGAGVASLVAANFSLAELRAIGLNATQLRKGGVDNPTNLRNAGYSLANLKAAGFNSTELKKAGFTYSELKEVGFDDIQLSSSGFTTTDTNTTNNTHLFSLYIDAERKALVDLWRATNGSKWKNKTNWNTEQPLSEWFGITVNKRGHVVKVILQSNNLQGSIPDSIHFLSYVKEMDLRMNQLSGPIPETIGDLTELKVLRLHCNRLNCKLPQALGRLQDITILDLRSNQLAGLQPLPFYELKNLSYLGISSNLIKYSEAEIRSKMPWLTKVN